MPKSVYSWLRTRSVNVGTSPTKLNLGNDWNALLIMNNSAIDVFAAFTQKGGIPTLSTSDYAFKIPPDTSKPTSLEVYDGKTVDVWAVVASGNLTLRIEELRIISR